MYLEQGDLRIRMANASLREVVIEDDEIEDKNGEKRVEDTWCGNNKELDEIKEDENEFEESEHEEQGNTYEISHYINHIDECLKPKANRLETPNAEKKSESTGTTDLSESNLTRRNWNWSSTMSVISELDKQRKSSLNIGRETTVDDNLRAKKSSLVSWEEVLGSHVLEKKLSLPIDLANLQIGNIPEDEDKEEMEWFQNEHKYKKKTSDKTTQIKVKRGVKFKEDLDKKREQQKNQKITKKLLSKNKYLDTLKEEESSGSSYVTLELSESDSFESVNHSIGMRYAESDDLRNSDNFECRSDLGMK